jgi:predicted nucleotidyltransferase component of viral defense system
MQILKRELLGGATKTGFRPEILEKVWHLMAILDEINRHPFLKERLVLKGGTALNLFMFDLPRLSVDIDLNYIGGIDKEIMFNERPQVEKALEAVFHHEGLTVHRMPVKHAGGKWQLKYPSVLVGNGNLEVDLNFMFRIPLGEVIKKRSCQIGAQQTQEVKVLDIHELGAGKLAALFARHASRDLFDACELLTKQSIDTERLRLFAIIYGAMGSKDWRTINIEDIKFKKDEMQKQLIPVLPKDTLKKGLDWPAWIGHMLAECQRGLQRILPLRENEREFLDRLLDHGEIKAPLLTESTAMIDTINSHPLIHWTSQLAIRNKGKRE